MRVIAAVDKRPLGGEIEVSLVLRIVIVLQTYSTNESGVYNLTDWDILRCYFFQTLTVTYNVCYVSELCPISKTRSASIFKANVMTGGHFPVINLINK